MSIHSAVGIHLRGWWHKVWPPLVDEDLREWFRELCDEHRVAWEAAVADARAEEEGKSRSEVELWLAENARNDLARLDAEINTLLVRTSILVAAATLLFAVYALAPSVKSPPASLGLALCFAAIAFVEALMPMRPPFVRAWRQSYEKRHDWTLLASTPFRRWVLDCWLADRRTPVIQRYKMAHAVSVPVLVLAAVCATFGLAIGLLF